MCEASRTHISSSSSSVSSLRFLVANTSSSRSVEAGDRIIIRGANGAGKSTLLKALIGEEEVRSGEERNDELRRRKYPQQLPLSAQKLFLTLTLSLRSSQGGGEVEVRAGARKVSPGVKMNVFNQDAAQDLDPDVTAVESVAKIVREYDISISDTVIRSVLGQLGLKSNAQQQKIKSLSGGEKARVALASFILKPANLLVLDEPSNHVDIGTIEALAAGLAAFEQGQRTKHAAVLVISHDREFVEKLDMTHVCSVAGGGVALEERNLRDDDWVVEGDGRAVEAAEENEGANAAAEQQGGGAAAKRELTGEERKKLFNAPKRIKKIEILVEDKEEKMKELDDSMLEFGSDVSKLTELSEKKTKLEAEVESLMAEWEELEELLAM